MAEGAEPKENRDIPPLNYERVHALKARRPELTISLNGGLLSVAHARENIGNLDGAMLGRAAYQQPFDVLRSVDQAFYGQANRWTGTLEDRLAIAEAMATYVDWQAQLGVPPKSITRHMMGYSTALAAPSYGAARVKMRPLRPMVILFATPCCLPPAFAAKPRNPNDANAARR